MNSVLLALALSSLPPAVPDRGGVSFDFEKLSAERFSFRIETRFCSYIGDTFEVSEGQVGELAFDFLLPGGPERLPADGVFRLELPPGIAWVDATFARAGSAKTECRADGSSVTEFLPSERFRSVSPGSWRPPHHLLVEATGGIGPCGEGRLGFGGVFSRPIRFSIGPHITGRQPRHFGCGGWQRDAYAFDDPRSVERLARFHADCGQNWIIPLAATNYPHLAIWRRCGFTKITPETGGWCVNGYSLGTGVPPASDRFVTVGTPDSQYAASFVDAVCPLAVAERTAYVRTNVFEALARHVRGVDGLWANWEPFMFEDHGCGCPRCGEAFARSIGRSYASIAPEWPYCAMIDGRYSRQGRKFRARCHAEVVKALDECVRAVTGRDSVGFMPGIHFGQVSSGWRTMDPIPEACAWAYADSLEWLSVWGPYVPWRASHPYAVERARHIAHFVCARDIRNQFAGRRRPLLLAGPQGTGGDYFTQPELFGMNFDAYFFNRFGGCCPWVFPMGADARYWRPFAAAATRAAKYEEIVSKGVPSGRQTVLETVPEYGAPVARTVPFLAKEKPHPQIFSASFDRAGVRIAAVFNCWQLGEAFFTLRARALPAGRYALVDETGVRYVRSREEPCYSAEELEKGVFLSVGSVRTRVFEIVPEGSDPLTAPTSLMTEAALHAAYEARRPALAEAALRDRRRAENDAHGVSRWD